MAINLKIFETSINLHMLYIPSKKELLEMREGLEWMDSGLPMGS